MGPGLLLSVLLAGVELSPDAPCSGPSLEQALSVSARALPAGSTVAVRRAREGVLELTLTNGVGPVLRREVPASGQDCAAVERVLVALVKAWRSSPELAGPRALRGDGGVRTAGAGEERVGGAWDGGEGASAAAAGGGDERDAGRAPVKTFVGGRGSDRSGSSSDGVASFASTGPAAARAAEANVEPPGSGAARVAAGAASAVGPTPGGAGRDGGASAASAGAADGGVPPDVAARPAAADTSPRLTTPAPETGASSVADSVSPWTFGVGLLGGITSGATAQVVPHGQLAFDVTRGWLGGALDVGLSGPVRQDAPPGAVEVSFQWASLSARGVLAVSERVTLEAQLGVRLHRLVGTASGFPQTTQQQLVSVGGVGVAGVSARVVGPLWVQVRATGVLRPAERFLIENLGPVLDLGPLDGAVTAGAVVRW